MFLECHRAFREGLVEQVAVVGGAVEVAFKQLLEQVDVGTLGVEHGLTVKVLLNDAFASVAADTQLDGGDLISVVVFHIVVFDVGHLAADGVLDGVDIANLTPTVDLVEVLRHVAVDDGFGIDDLPIDAFVGGPLHTDGGQLFLEKRDVFLLLGYDDLDVVAGIGRKDEVDILQADIYAGGKYLLHLTFEDEMSLGVGLSLVDENAFLIDEVLVGEEPYQCVGLVAPSGNRHILGGCRNEEQR